MKIKSECTGQVSIYANLSPLRHEQMIYGYNDSIGGAQLHRRIMHIFFRIDGIKQPAATRGEACEDIFVGEP